MKRLIQHKVSVQPSLIHGYGVFARQLIKKDDIIEECYCINSEENDLLLHGYHFAKGDNAVVALGNGSIYNHADSPNAIYYFDEKTNLLLIKAKNDIAKGDEIFIFYGKTWFSDRNMPVKKIPLWRKFLRFTKGIPLRAGLAMSGLFITVQIVYFLTAPELNQKISQTIAKTTQLNSNA